MLDRLAQRPTARKKPHSRPSINRRRHNCSPVNTVPSANQSPGAEPPRFFFVGAVQMILISYLRHVLRQH
jgi:hypothetical protein